MRPEDLAEEINHLNGVCDQRTGRDRLEKQARLIRLKARLAGRAGSELAARLDGVDDVTRDCLQADVRRAASAPAQSDDHPDRAFERAMSTIESLIATHH